MENQKLEMLLETLRKDIQFYKDSLKETAKEMVDENYTQYPVFAAHSHILDLGELVFDRVEYGRNWSINVTTLEELISKNLITPDKVQAFKKTFRDPEKEMCILMITPEGASFIFLPY